MADTKELPKDIEEGITKFDQTSLKHTETVERNSLPSPEGKLRQNTQITPLPLLLYTQVSN